MKLHTVCLTLALSSFYGSLALAAPLPSKPLITLSAAKTAVASIAPLLQKQHTANVISVVDDGGHLIYLERADGAASGMVDASIKKARTAANYGFPTKALEQQIAQGHNGFLGLPGILPMEGGVPVMISGQLIGAVGVAGGVSSDDGAYAEQIAAALSKLDQVIQEMH
ncbi:heme-binding protein [Pseudomonas gingeri]|uniref:GlcG/HbpS family heme-binding protein n=1 Tax=Pseudomonas gingeri TaxID=117681 RepID=UPI0015A38021|nr:heme-binding protein [Pseudomonas gingeri]NWD77303.1 heme-binding protein [Pseudomonas gingeri]